MGSMHFRKENGTPGSERCFHLTFDIVTVYRQANNINMLKEGMKIEATHVKKKQLHHYLPAEILQKKKKVSL